jgi:hypothetical protein
MKRAPVTALLSSGSSALVSSLPPHPLSLLKY